MTTDEPTETISRLRQSLHTLDLLCVERAEIIDRQAAKITTLTEALEGALSWLATYPGGGAKRAHEAAQKAIKEARA